MSPASGGDGSVVARPRALNLRRGKGRGLNNVWHGYLLGVLGKVLGESTGSEDRRRNELSNDCLAAVAGARLRRAGSSVRPHASV
jgi:hypothetical protein